MTEELEDGNPTEATEEGREELHRGQVRPAEEPGDAERLRAERSPPSGVERRSTMGSYATTTRESLTRRS